MAKPEGSVVAALLRTVVSGAVAEGLRDYAQQEANEKGDDSLTARLARVAHHVAQNQAARHDAQYEGHSRRASIDKLSSSYQAHASEHPRRPEPMPEAPEASAAGVSAQRYFERGEAAEKAGDFDAALANYIEAIDRGHATAMNSLGGCFENGRGVPPNDEEAAGWYGRAANAGSARGMFNLGRFHKFGQGVACDLEQAAFWYTQAAEHGHVVAMNDLGVMFAKGQGVGKSFELSAHWYGQAAEAGLAAAQRNLAVLYRKGLGVPCDRARARHWYDQAAAQGNADARAALDEMAAEDAREQENTKNAGTPAGSEMSRAQALELLDLKEGATLQEIKAAYSRLMQIVHPDKGGSTAFAKQLNAAREVLFGK